MQSYPVRAPLWWGGGRGAAWEHEYSGPRKASVRAITLTAQSPKQPGTGGAQSSVDTALPLHSWPSHHSMGVHMGLLILIPGAGQVAWLPASELSLATHQSTPGMPLACRVPRHSLLRYLSAGDEECPCGSLQGRTITNPAPRQLHKQGQGGSQGGHSHGPESSSQSPKPREATELVPGE